MNPPRQHKPLTQEQQRLVAQWLPFANGLAIKFLARRPHLRHREDDLFAAARNAGMTAIYKWEPARGTYASCLAWWVRAALQEVEREEANPKAFVTWETAVTVNPSGRLVVGWNDTLPLAESLPAPPPTDTHEEEAALYAQRMADEVPLYLVGHCAAPSIQRFARESVALWRRWRINGETQESLAREVGCSRQGMSQRLARVERAFAKWAESIRKEAA